MEGYTGTVHDKESWFKALLNLMGEGMGSDLDPHYMHDELESAAESVLLLLDTEDAQQPVGTP